MMIHEGKCYFNVFENYRRLKTDILIVFAKFSFEINVLIVNFINIYVINVLTKSLQNAKLNKINILFV